MDKIPTQAPLPLTAEERAVLRFKEERQKALEKLPETLARAELLIRSMGGKVKITAQPDGSRTIRTQQRQLRYGPNATSLRVGSIFQRPAQATLSAAIDMRTVEADVFHTIRDAVPAANRDPVIIKAATREAVDDMWTCGAPEMYFTGKLGRRVPTLLRPRVAQILADAHKTGSEAARRTRQAINVMPALACFVPAPDLIKAALAGTSTEAIAKAHDGTKALAKLDRHSLLLVTPANVRLICKLLETIRDVPELHLTGRAFRAWLETMLRWWSFGEPVPGFAAWLARGSYAYAFHRGVPGNLCLLELALWVQASHDKRGGWSDKRAFSRCLVEAGAWADGLSDQARRSNTATHLATFEERRPATFHGARCVKPLRTADELYDAGVTLSNCMQHFAQLFALDAKTGAAIYLGVYSVTTKTDPQSAVVMQVHDRLLSVAEVRLDAAGRSLGVRQHTAWKNTPPMKVDAAAVQAWIEERL